MDDAIVPTALAPGVMGKHGMAKENENPSAETSIFVSQTMYTSKQKDTGMQKIDAKSLQLRRIIPM